MAIQLRILLIVVSFLTVLFVLRKVRKAQMKIEDSILWIVMPMLILVLSIFPGVAMQTAKWCGVESPANFVYLFIIFLLIIIIFSLSIKISKLEYKISGLVQELAIRENENKKRKG